MGPPASPAPAAGAPPLSPEDRRWLHDKYERLASEEGQLTSLRTSYYAAIGTVLITGLIVAIADLESQHLLLLVVTAFLAALGLMISVIWAVLLHRTTDAQNLWREAALRLEESDPPIEGSWMVPITLRSGQTLQVDLLRPYQAHAARFSRANPISRWDRFDPALLTEVLPLTFIGLWATVLVVMPIWLLVVL